MANERNSILVALGMGLLAGVLAALGLVLFSSSMAVAADESTPDLLPGVDLVTEEVAPGVYRVLGDGVRIGRILHPSPANPRANRDWAGEVRAQIRDLGLCDLRERKLGSAPRRSGRSQGPNQDARARHGPRESTPPGNRKSRKKGKS